MNTVRDIQLREYFADLERSRHVVIVNATPTLLNGRMGYVRDTWGSMLIINLDMPVTPQEAREAGFEDVQAITHDSHGFVVVLPETYVVRAMPVPDWRDLDGIQSHA